MIHISSEAKQIIETNINTEPKCWRELYNFRL